MAEDRANDLRRVADLYSHLGGTPEDAAAQRKFTAHGSNKGKASDMSNLGNKVDMSFKQTGGTARASRYKTKGNIEARGTFTSDQKGKSVN